MTSQLVLNIFKLSSSKCIEVYQGVCFAKEGFT